MPVSVISHSYEKYVQSALAWQRAWQSSAFPRFGSMVSVPEYLK